jgi:hypothetical protein
MLSGPDVCRRKNLFLPIPQYNSPLYALGDITPVEREQGDIEHHDTSHAYHSLETPLTQAIHAATLPHTGSVPGDSRRYWL